MLNDSPISESGEYSITAPLTPPATPSKRSIIRGGSNYPYQHFYSDKRQSSPVHSDDVWLYPGWGDVSREEVDTNRVHPVEDKKTLGVFRATSIAGNDLLASVLYTIGVTTSHAGPLSFLSLLIVSINNCQFGEVNVSLTSKICVFLWPYRFIYSEVGTALPLNGGSYNCLLNATTK